VIVVDRLHACLMDDTPCDGTIQQRCSASCTLLVLPAFAMFLGVVEGRGGKRSGVTGGGTDGEPSRRGRRWRLRMLLARTEDGRSYYHCTEMPALDVPSGGLKKSRWKRRGMAILSNEFRRPIYVLELVGPCGGSISPTVFSASVLSLLRCCCGETARAAAAYVSLFALWRWLFTCRGGAALAWAWRAAWRHVFAGKMKGRRKTIALSLHHLSGRMAAA